MRIRRLFCIETIFQRENAYQPWKSAFEMLAFVWNQILITGTSKKKKNITIKHTKYFFVYSRFVLCFLLPANFQLLLSHRHLCYISCLFVLFLIISYFILYLSFLWNFSILFAPFQWNTFFFSFMSDSPLLESSFFMKAVRLIRFAICRTFPTCSSQRSDDLQPWSAQLFRGSACNIFLSFKISAAVRASIFGHCSSRLFFITLVQRQKIPKKKVDRMCERVIEKERRERETEKERREREANNVGKKK